MPALESVFKAIQKRLSQSPQSALKLLSYFSQCHTNLPNGEKTSFPPLNTEVSLYTCPYQRPKSIPMSHGNIEIPEHNTEKERLETWLRS